MPIYLAYASSINLISIENDNVDYLIDIVKKILCGEQRISYMNSTKHTTMNHSSSRTTMARLTGARVGTCRAGEP